MPESSSSLINQYMHHDKNEEADPGAVRISLLPILHSDDMPGPPERKHQRSRLHSPVRRWLLVPNLHRIIGLYVCICLYIYDSLSKCLFPVLLINRNSMRAASCLPLKNKTYLDDVKTWKFFVTFGNLSKTTGIG